MFDEEKLQKLEKQVIFLLQMHDEVLQHNQTILKNLNNIQTEFESKSQETLRQVTKECYQELEKHTQKMADNIEYSGRRFVKGTAYVDSRMKYYQWWGIGSSIIIALLIIAIPSIYLYLKKQEINSVHYMVKEKNIIERNLSKCDDDLCIRIDKNATTWKSNPSYVILK